MIMNYDKNRNATVPGSHFSLEVHLFVTILSSETIKRLADY